MGSFCILCEMLETPLEEMARLTKDQKSALRRLNLHTIRDLLYHFPARYEDTAQRGSAASLIHGEKVTLYGRLTKVEAKKLWKSRVPAAEGTFEDGSGRARVLWFHQPYMAKMAPLNQPIALTGMVAGKDRPYISNPEITPLSTAMLNEGMFAPEEKGASKLFPVYPETKGITSRWMYHTLKNCSRQPI